jgi:hypothetical protein
VWIGVRLMDEPQQCVGDCRVADFPSAQIVSIRTERSPLERSGVSTGNADGSFRPPSPLTANARV